MNEDSLVAAEISACEKQLYAAMLASDVSVLQELICEDLLFVGPSGEIITKEMDLALHRSGGINISRLEPKEQEIRCLDDAAVAVTKIFVAGTLRGNNFAANMRYTRIWRRTKKGWQILAGHCSAIV